MITRRQVVTNAGLVGAAYAAGYLTPIGRVAAGFIAKCGGQAPAQVLPLGAPALPPPKHPYELLFTRLIPVDGNSTSFCGLARNNTPSLSNIEVSMRFYTNGVKVGEAQDFAFVDVIPPGGVSPFLVSTDAPMPAGVKVVVEADGSGTLDSLPHIQIVRSRLALDASGIPILSGIVRNVGDGTANTVGVAVAFFGKDGTVLYAYQAFADQQQLIPQATSSFNFSATTHGTALTIPQGAVSYQLYATGIGPV